MPIQNTTSHSNLTNNFLQKIKVNKCIYRTLSNLTIEMEHFAKIVNGFYPC